MHTKSEKLQKREKKIGTNCVSDYLCDAIPFGRFFVDCIHLSGQLYQARQAYNSWPMAFVRMYRWPIHNRNVS